MEVADKVGRAFAAGRWLAGFGVVVACVASIGVGAQPRVEQGEYLTGAWFGANTDAGRELYRAAGFNLVRYDAKNVEWATRNGMRFIGAVSAWGIPGSVNRPFESMDGIKSHSVGLFTHVNFNAPSVETWWRRRVPELVRGMPAADWVAYWKVHNEFGYHSGKVFDYSPGTVAAYRRWLHERYGDLTSLNRRWGAEYESFADIQPPRSDLEQQLPNWLEWRRFTCWNFADYFRRTGDLIRQVVPAAQVSDNFYPTSPMQGWDLFELARQTDYLALDIYAIGRWDSLRQGLDSGRTAAAAAGKPFSMMEYHAGPNHWARVVRRRDLLIETGLALARECRSIMWFRFQPGNAGRERGIHGITDSAGQPTERFLAVAQTSAFTARLASLLARTRTDAQVAIVTSTDNAFLAYARREDGFRDRRRWWNLGRLLDAARIQWDEVDPQWLVNGDLARFRVLVMAHLPLLSEAVWERVQTFAMNGGTVVIHPGTGAADDLGHPRAWSPFTDAVADNGTWRVRGRKGGQPELWERRVGKGKFVFCAWELPDRWPDAARVRQQSSAYAHLLSAWAGVKPSLALVNAPETVDARRLQAGKATVIVLTQQGDPVRGVEVIAPGAPAAGAALLLSPADGAVRRTAVQARDDGVHFVVDQIDPVTVAVLGEWQPVVGIQAPVVVHPGETRPVVVTVDNPTARRVRCRVALHTPSGWSAKASGPTSLTVQPHGRGEANFEVQVPANAAADRYGARYRLEAGAEFVDGFRGALKVRQVMIVRPALDVELVYHGQILNPTQELTPPIMRWGWQNEVRTPPPPPVSIRAPAPVSVRAHAASSLAGQPLQLKLSEGDVEYPVLRLRPGLNEVSAQLSMQRPGEHRMRATVGERVTEATFTAGVNTETVQRVVDQARERSQLPGRVAAWIGVGARGAAGKGSPVTINLPSAAPKRGQCEVRMVREGAVTPVAADIAGKTVTLAADVAKDQVTVYAILADADSPRGPRRVNMQSDGSLLLVSGDRYRVCFDSYLGVVQSMDLDGKPALRHRTGVVARLPDGSEWAPNAESAATAFHAGASRVSAQVGFQRLLGPALSVQEDWDLEAARVSIRIRVANVSSSPVTLSSLRYELGLDSDVFPRWRRGMEGEAVDRGALPPGFGMLSGVRFVDWLKASGAGLGLTLGLCAQNLQWAELPMSVLHQPALTAVHLVGNARIDPGDYIVADFALWPHGPAEAEFAAPQWVVVSFDGEGRVSRR